MFVRLSAFIFFLLSLPLVVNADDTSVQQSWLLAKYDVNGDKVISADEIFEKRSNLFSSMDFNADGGVTFNEYENMDAQKRQLLLKARFNKLDLNQDGELSNEEYISYLGNFEDFDTDGDGKITPAEMAIEENEVPAEHIEEKTKLSDNAKCLLWFCVRKSIH